MYGACCCNCRTPEPKTRGRSMRQGLAVFCPWSPYDSTLPTFTDVGDWVACLSVLALAPVRAQRVGALGTNTQTRDGLALVYV